MKLQIHWTKEQLENLYLTQDMSLLEVGAHLGCCSETVRKKLVEFGIPRKPAKNRPGRPQPNKARKGAANGFWKNGQTIDKSGYILVWKPDHPGSNSRGYVREHRIVMEQKIGRPLRSEEVVDHRDRVTSNNHPDNLELYPNNAAHLAATLKGHCPNWSPAGYENMLRTAQKKAEILVASRARLEAYALLHNVSVSQIQSVLLPYERRLLSKALQRGQFEAHPKIAQLHAGATPALPAP